MLGEDFLFNRINCKNMKLELKHLIYQNFKPLNVLFKDKSIDLIVSIDFEYGVISFLNSNGNRLLKDNSFMLILRPLSDLTKEIEVNGKKFIPIDEIKTELLGVDWLVFGESKYGWTGFVDQSNNSQANHIPIYIGNEIMGECNYYIYQKLVEWHFDISGLIDAGLAVDINTVKF